MNCNENLYSNCKLCPRECGADRIGDKRGFCGEGSKMRIARAALHFWEEPCLSGAEDDGRGSGTVFFSGCTMRCVYCQNGDIACGEVGREITAERLVEIFHELENKGAYNINLVTPDCFIPEIAAAVRAAKESGFALPFVFNVSGYEKVETLRMLEGLCDIWLTDYRYNEEKPARLYSAAGDYPEVARAAIAEMVRQKPKPVYGADGMLKEGVIVRQLLLPGHLRNSRGAVKYLHETYGENIIISLMSQYTPTGKTGFSELERTVTEAEYDAFVRYALDLGIENAYVQDGASAKESFIPAFDYEGV